LWCGRSPFTSRSIDRAAPQPAFTAHHAANSAHGGQVRRESRPRHRDRALPQVDDGSSFDEKDSQLLLLSEPRRRRVVVHFGIVVILGGSSSFTSASSSFSAARRRSLRHRRHSRRARRRRRRIRYRDITLLLLPRLFRYSISSSDF
jgi:hypothetical protein